MMKTMNWAAWPLKNFRITALVVALLTGFGIFGMYKMPKDEFPPFVIRQGLVVAVCPGATSEEIEAQIARPLERYLFTFKEVKRSKTTTTSTQGMCIVMVALNDEVDNKDEVWSKIKHGLNSFKQQLPSNVAALAANDNFGDTSALLIAIESSQRSYRELLQYSDDIADRLRRIKSVSNVQQVAVRQEQISLYVDRDRLSAYGIGPATIAQTLMAQGFTTMSGNISTATQNLDFHIAPSLQSEREIAEQIIYADASGRCVRIKDIARVVREYDLSDGYVEQNGNRCVLLSLEMTEGNNIVEYGKEVDAALEAYSKSSLPTDIKMTRITDLPQVVGDSVKDFLINLLESMLIIFAVMLVLFPWRSAVVTAATVPLSTFISVGIMYAFGIPLNIISLACLIVVLGMIVDNSIVVVDGYLEYLGKGMGRNEAALESVRQYFFPMLLATLCICAIFYPIVLTMTGDAGDVVGIFPVCITINLMVSLALAVCVMPALEAGVIKKAFGRRKANGKKDLTEYVQALYDRVLAWNFRHPRLTIGGALLLVAMGGMIFPQLKMRQFPYADRNQFAVEIYLPEGSGLADTKTIADSMRQVLLQDDRVTGVTSFIACSSPRFHVAYAPKKGGKNFAQLIVNTPDTRTTNQVIDEYMLNYSNRWPNAYVKFQQMDFLDVPTYEYRFYGENLDSIRAAAEQLMAEMRTIPELEWVHTDYDLPHPMAEVRLDAVRAAQLGFNRTTAALQMAMNAGDVQVGSIWESVNGVGQKGERGVPLSYELPVVLRSEPDRALKDFDDVQDLHLVPPAAMANSAVGRTGSVPLRQVAEVEPVWTETNIVHRNGERCISVLAEGKRGTLALPIQNRIVEYVGQMTLPQGVRAEIGGETEKNNEMLPQIASGLSLSMVVIFFFLLFNFKRFDITFLSIAAIGLSLPGAMLGLWVADRVLGLTSLFGFITLMGIIMRNEILIFEHADQKMADGLSARDAAFDAGRRRMVPIFLTTATTAVGVIPMIIGQSSFWMPVGITIFAGGIGTLLLVVTVLPVVYWKIYEGKRRPQEVQDAPIAANH